MNIEQLKELIHKLDDELEVQVEYYDGGSKWLYYDAEASVQGDGNGKQALVFSMTGVPK